MNARDGVRGVLFGTLPGRAIVVGLAIKFGVALIRSLVGPIPAFLSVIETVAGLAVAAGLIYFVIRLLVLAKRRLLWRVRRKLILSYIFVGFVPALLLAAFALLCGFLLFYHLSSYLVQSRLRALSDQARYFAQTAAVEIQRAGGRDIPAILARRQAAIASQFPDASLDVLAVGPDCHARDAQVVATAGPWAHVAPPRTIPEWITCAGFAGVLAYEHPRGASADRDTHLVEIGRAHV